MRDKYRGGQEIVGTGKPPITNRIPPLPPPAGGRTPEHPAMQEGLSSGDVHIVFSTPTSSGVAKRQRMDRVLRTTDHIPAPPQVVDMLEGLDQSSREEVEAAIRNAINGQSYKRVARRLVWAGAGVVAICAVVAAVVTHRRKARAN